MYVKVLFMKWCNEIVYRQVTSCIIQIQVVPTIVLEEVESGNSHMTVFSGVTQLFTILLYLCC